MTIVSRLQLNHPALGATPGAALHNQIEDIYIRIGDNVSSRFFTASNINVGAFVDFEHNFKTAFSTLAFDVYLLNTLTGELTLVTDQTTPSLTAISIAPVVGFETTKIRVTNNHVAGVAVAITVRHFALKSSSVRSVFKNVSSDVSLASGYVHLIDTTAQRTLTLPNPALTTGLITIKDKSGLAGTNNIFIQRFGSEQIEGVAFTYTVQSGFASLTLATDGTNWFIV